MSPTQLQRSIGGGNAVRRAEVGYGHATGISIGQTMVSVAGIDTFLAVMAGVQDAKEGRVFDLGSFAQFAEDESK